MQTNTNTSRPSRTGAARGEKRTFRGPARRSGGGQRRTDVRRGGNSGRRRGGGRKMPTFDPSQFINKNPAALNVEVYEPKHTFTTFGLDAQLVKVITGSGITIPTPIQDQIIPEILAGRDVVGLAETGTGKTAAFLAPLIHQTLSNQSQQTLIMAPTRELAIQIDTELHKLSRGMRLHSVVCVGGMNIRPQIKALGRRQQFIIGTPGRLLDLMKRKYFKPAGVNAVVLDEADRMLDMGFIHDMRSLLSQVPEKRQTLLFSATMSSEAEKFAGEFLRNPSKVSVKKTDVTNSIKQDVVPYETAKKFETLIDLLSKKEFERVLVFGAMKHSVEKLSNELSNKGVRAVSIHGNKSHGQRQRALNDFKSGRARVLVATDVAARGIHVDGVTHVINYDLPTAFADYVHRIGRTGRGDKSGEALTFVAK